MLIVTLRTNHFPVRPDRRAAGLTSNTSGRALFGARQPITNRNGSGHGLGTALSERIEEKTDVYAFLFDQLGVTAKR